MGRLIDVDVLIKRFKALMGKEIKLLMLIADVIKIIKEQPIVDAVEVVRCEKCRYKKSSGFCRHPRHSGIIPAVYPNDFCSYGERRSDETD